MKNFLILFALAGIGTSAFAQVFPLVDGPSVEVSRLMACIDVYKDMVSQVQRPDPSAFCYVEDKVYSEGYELNAMRCERTVEAQQGPLTWVKVKT